MTIISTTQETEAIGSLEFKSSKIAWATQVKLYLKKKKKKNLANYQKVS